MSDTRAARTSGNREAAVAADRSGRVERVALVRPGEVARTARACGAMPMLLVVKLPPGPPGTGSSRESSRRVAPADLVLVIQDPSHITRRLVAMGAAGLDGGTTLYSDSTRTDGLVSSTDVAPTVLEHLGRRGARRHGGTSRSRHGATPRRRISSELRNRLTASARAAGP